MKKYVKIIYINDNFVKMQLNKITSNNIESFADNKILENPEIKSLFNENHIDITSFMKVFRKACLEQDNEALIQLGYDNYEEKIHRSNLGGFDVLSGLFKLSGINISAEYLFNQLGNFQLTRTVQKTVNKLNETLGK